MVKREVKENNHLYPAFHIRKWITSDGKIYDKSLNKENKIREIIKKKDFTEKFYYSLGEVDDELENRIGEFERVFAPIIQKIVEAKNSVQFSAIELELLKLYCYLCACRQDKTCEVIKNDESCVYKSNNYLFGTPKIETQDAVIGITEKILDEFERIKNNFVDGTTTIFTAGLHVAIVRAKEPIIMISDRISIIENTMDSNHLYTYIPISPYMAVLLVKSKYYYDEDAFNNTKIRFGIEYGDGSPDEYLSDLFGAEVGNYESSLFCDYYTDSTLSKHCERENSSLYIKIHNLPKDIFRLFNSIYCEDGTKILFCDEEELNFALKHSLYCRNI